MDIDGKVKGGGFLVPGNVLFLESWLHIYSFYDNVLKSICMNHSFLYTVHNLQFKTKLLSKNKSKVKVQ